MKLPEIGQVATATMTITDEAVREFARLSGDNNPIHLDEEYAAKTRFKRRIAHGMMTASLLSRVAGTQLPGPGSIYLNQHMKFKQPAYIGDTVVAEIKVLNIRPDKPIVSLSTIVRNQNGEILMDGEALVYYEPVV
ncbi:MAG: MaoC family dehydratase [Bdellovibrionaceae bacterium]|nr:MaoC family dehydratase [Pseudobdellovibrionaceae bacterium]